MGEPSGCRVSISWLGYLFAADKAAVIPVSTLSNTYSQVACSMRLTGHRVVPGFSEGASETICWKCNQPQTTHPFERPQLAVRMYSEHSNQQGCTTDSMCHRHPDDVSAF